MRAKGKQQRTDGYRGREVMEYYRFVILLSLLSKMRFTLKHFAHDSELTNVEKSL